MIILICGSPRDGNTQSMLERVEWGANKAGAQTEMILMKDLDIRPCDGCLACEEVGECSHIKDGMKDILDRLVDAKAIVFGTPAYFNNMSTLFKIFSDRTVPLLENKELRGKPYAIVAVGAQDVGEGSIEKCEQAVKEVAEIHEMKFVDSVLANATDPKEIESNEDKMEECKALGKRLANL